VTINMTSSGFSPSEVTVKAGDTVMFKNTDSSLHWPASNPHPTHTDLAAFDALRGLSSGQTYSFKFTKVGTWGFHDHLHASLGGHVTVK
jgi:plastocyanin